MIYDCFMVFNELDLLEIRMNILSPHVDYFVITESTETFMGDKKPLYFKENIERFRKFKDKILYNYVDTRGMVFQNQFEREKYIKNNCLNPILERDDDDIVMYSDLDEIPNPSAIERVVSDFQNNKVYHLAQRVFYAYMNYENIDGKILSPSGEFEGIKEKSWLGTKITALSLAKIISCDGLRTPKLINENAERVSNGGWHFSWMGGSGESAYKRIKDKCKAFSHNEYNNPKYYNPIRLNYCLLKGRDFLRGGKDSPKFRLIDIDETYPQWLIEHYKEYPHFWKNKGMLWLQRIIM